MNGVPPSRVCLVSPKLGARGELARHGLPKRSQQLMLLSARKGPSPWCSPCRGRQRERNRIKTPTTSRWPLLTLEHVQANDEHRRIGKEDTRAWSSSNAVTTSA